MTYEIINDSLYLRDVEILITVESKFGKDVPPDILGKSVFKNFFPSQKRIPMTEYNQILTIPYGDMNFITENDWNEIYYDNYLIFQIKNGKIIKELNLTYKEKTELKEKLFLKFKNTLKYQEVSKNKIEELNKFNCYRPVKYTMDEYLKLTILEIVNEL